MSVNVYVFVAGTVPLWKSKKLPADFRTKRTDTGNGLLVCSSSLIPTILD